MLYVNTCSTKFETALSFMIYIFDLSTYEYVYTITEVLVHVEFIDYVLPNLFYWIFNPIEICKIF